MTARTVGALSDGAASAAWLSLREPADAAARSTRLSARVAELLGSGPVEVHDIGCGSGSMGRWLAPRLPGRQHWVLHDRDPDLLGVARRHPPPTSATGEPVTVETRRGDLDQLTARELGTASLVTASALLDLLSAEQLSGLVDGCIRANCPMLLTLSVTGRVSFNIPDPLDVPLQAAFNDHQRRVVDGRHLLGADAVAYAAGLFRKGGWVVEVDDSPWLLGVDQRTLAGDWLAGWVGAAVEQRPELAAPAVDCLEGRRRELDAGRLRITVAHVDLLALPGEGPS